MVLKICQIAINMGYGSKLYLIGFKEFEIFGQNDAPAGISFV
jgi:hypothetical protein